MNTNYKPKEFAELVGVSVKTLQRWDRDGILKANRTPTDRRYYIQSQYLEFKGLNVDKDTRKVIIYSRVSTNKQKKDLENQIELLKQFCFSNGYRISVIYKDIASGIDFENRKDFFVMLDDIINGKIERVVITYKDRLSRVGFSLFSKLFNRYKRDIVVMSEIGSSKLDSQKIFEEIVSLLHCYSMKLYSKRRIQKIKEVLENDSD